MITKTTDYPGFRARLFCPVALGIGAWFAQAAAGAISDANWTTVGSGMSNGVLALAVSGGDLYAGGAFTNAGGVAANYIAKWDGSSWSALGSGMNGVVRALAVSGSNLYAGGDFTMASDLAVNS